MMMFNRGNGNGKIEGASFVKLLASKLLFVCYQAAIQIGMYVKKCLTNKENLLTLSKTWLFEDLQILIIPCRLFLSCEASLTSCNYLSSSITVCSYFNLQLSQLTNLTQLAQLAQLTSSKLWYTLVNFSKHLVNFKIIQENFVKFCIPRQTQVELVKFSKT